MYLESRTSGSFLSHLPHLSETLRMKQKHCLKGTSDTFQQTELSSHFSFFTSHRDDSTVSLKAGGGLNWILHSSYIVISLCAENKISSLVNKTAGCNKYIMQLNDFYDNRSILSQGISSHCTQPTTELWGNKVAIAFPQAQYFCCNFL